MAIRYLLGRSGSGKSHRVLQEIKQSLLDNAEEQLILLVPEQFTLQAERDLIQKLHLPGIINVEVLSFTRLARRVFSEVGGVTRTRLNEQGKNMVLRKMIDEAARDLTIYKKSAGQEGFIPKLSELLSELKGQDIVPEQLLASFTDDEELIIKQKVNDIALIYDHFNQYLQGRYLDTEDFLSLLIDKINASSYLLNSRIWVDGFSTFSPQSLKIIDRLMQAARDITISLTMSYDRRDRDNDLFSLSRDSLQKLQVMAGLHACPQEIIRVDAAEARAGQNPALIHLERELYAYPGQVFRENPRDIELFAAANLNSELEYAAAQIVELVRERGWRWKDLAVVCNDMSNYGSLIKRVFDEYGIPSFMDEKRDIMNNAIIKLILSSVDVIRRNYRYEDVFSFLKTGFSGLDHDKVEKLENYVLQYGIGGRQWEEEFAWGQAALRDELNQARQDFILPLTRLQAQINGKQTIAAICRAHYQYLVDLGVPGRLEEWIETMNSQGRFEVVRENTQIWNIVLEIFDQMVEILGDQEVNLKEYRNILEAGFASQEVGIIPTTVDQVLVGNIQRSKSHDIKGLLVLGVNDGVLPSGQAEEGLFSEVEKEMLMARGVDLGFERHRKQAEERFLIYTALSKPRQYLGLSFALADGDGKALRPSLLIDRLRQLFPSLRVQSDVIKHRPLEIHQVSTPVSSYKYLIENLRLHFDGKPVSDFWGDVYTWYQAQEGWRENLNLMREGLFHRNQARTIGAVNARRLYATPFYSNISRMEQFVNCPFAHFVRYGLKPQERKVFTVGAPDIGELLHNSLLAFALQVQRENKNWAELQRPECEGIMDGIMDALVPQQGNGIFVSSHRYRYLARRLKRISRRAVWILTEHLQHGDFKPLQYEVSFGPGCPFPPIEIELENGESFYLQGRIDRVDLLEEEDGIYVKIIDYKSGSQDFKLSDVYYGLSLQLMIYLRAVMASFKDVPPERLKPAGVFYFKIEDPLINSEAEIIANIEQEIARKLKMKGLVLEDARLIRKLDDQIAGSSAIIPVTMTVNGGFAKTSSVLPVAGFAALIRHVEELLRKIGREIMAGAARIEPVKNGQRRACAYCAYPSVCQFDRLLPDNNYKNIRPLKDDEVIARLQAYQEVQHDAELD
ncbi:MAG: helicase-exonuclease AddAB subunit AddB [Syntrophomonadaceae bacterium]|nr:helicase-exonuclease AddAB subunit AddB [Syntrophomonadaceae bacterium]